MIISIEISVSSISNRVLQLHLVQERFYKKETLSRRQIMLYREQKKAGLRANDAVYREAVPF